MLKKVIFWGASGHAKVLREFIDKIGYDLIAIFDNDFEAITPFTNIPLYFGMTGFQKWKDKQDNLEIACLVAIGGARGQSRLEIQQTLEANLCIPIIAIHPTAFVASNAKVSKGCQILANASVCADVVMGESCIINTASSVDHETVLGQGVHIAPGATLAGCVSVGNCSLIGPGAVILPRVKIGSNVIVGAGAVVTKDVPDGKIVFGIPAKIKRDNKGERDEQRP